MRFIPVYTDVSLSLASLSLAACKIVRVTMRRILFFFFPFLFVSYLEEIVINEYRFRKCRETHLGGSRISNIFLLKLKTVVYVLRVVIEHVDSQALRLVNNK